MKIRLIQATFYSAVFLLALCALLGNAALADESLRIERPQRSAPETAPAAEAPPSNSCCGTSSCSASAACSSGLFEGELRNSLPPDGLFSRWRAEFVNPTMCPILLCHGSCAGSQMSCKYIKTMIDSLLDAYIPEEPSVQSVLNFRCCAGFTDDQ